MSQCRGTAGERLRDRQRDVRVWFDEGEVLLVGRGLIEIEGLVADGVTPAAFEGVAVVVENLEERTLVDDSLVPLEARALLAFPSLDGDRAELDALDGLPGRVIPFEDLDAVEPGVRECLEETFLGVGAADASAPKIGVVLEVEGNLLVGNDVGDDCPAAFFQDAEDFFKQLRLSGVSTRLSTQLETTASMLSLGTSGCFTRRSAAMASAAR